MGRYQQHQYVASDRTFVLPFEGSSRANPPRGGDAKPGISSRPPGRRSQSEPYPLKGETDREGEPGALHLGADAARIDGAVRRRRDPVGLVLNAMFKAQAFRVILALMTLASSALVIQAGQRWH
jgi:hypothetical protein